MKQIFFILFITLIFITINAAITNSASEKYTHKNSIKENVPYMDNDCTQYECISQEQEDDDSIFLLTYYTIGLFILTFILLRNPRP